MGYVTTMPKGYTFVGAHSPARISVNGTDASISYAKWINLYCGTYKYSNMPLDANAIAGLISTEDSSWDPALKGHDSGSYGLGQFTDGTAPSYGLGLHADRINPEKNIKAICLYISKNLLLSNGNYNLAYRIYNSGSLHNAQYNDAIAHGKNFDAQYALWVKTGDAKAGTSANSTQITPQAPTDNNMKLGSKGTNVLKLQTDLKKLGYTISLDSIYGPGTVATVKLYQQKRGLTNDGIAGPSTLKLIATDISNLKVPTVKQINPINPSVNTPKGTPSKAIPGKAPTSSKPIVPSKASLPSTKPNVTTPVIKTPPVVIRSGIPVIGLILMVLVIGQIKL